jgi:hypothetical protein
VQSDCVGLFGTITVDIDAELARLDRPGTDLCATQRRRSPRRPAKRSRCGTVRDRDTPQTGRPQPQTSGKVLGPGCAALRNYAITLHAALAPTGVYAGTVPVGGLIERSDIHRALASDPSTFGDSISGTLDPDDPAEEAWGLYRDPDARRLS